MDKSGVAVGQAEPALIKKETSFASDVLKLASGATFAQVLGVLVAPILARLYGPEAFGVLRLFTSITSIAGVVVCMRYEISIMLPESDEEAANLLGVSLGFVILVSGLMALIVWFGRPLLLRWLRAPELGPYLWLVPPAVFVGGVLLALNSWNTRTKHFAHMSVARVARSVTTAGLQLGAGYAGYAVGGSLISANVIGSSVYALVLGGRTWRDDLALFSRSLKWQDMFRGMKRYRKFPLYDMWARLFNSLSWQLPAFLLSSFFSSTVVGYYALGDHLLRLPMNVIGSAIAQVFLQRAAEAETEGALASVVESAFRRLVMLGMFPMLLLTIIGRDLFTVVLGDSWAEAGVYTQILSIWTFFWFISSPLSTLFRVLEKQESSLILNVAILATRAIALGIGGLLGNARMALVLFAVSGVLLYGYLSLSIVHVSGVSWSNVSRILFSNVVLFVPAGFILLVLNVVGVRSWVQVAAAGGLLGVYLAYVARTDPLIHSLFKRVGIRQGLVGGPRAQ